MTFVNSHLTPQRNIAHITYEESPLGAASGLWTCGLFISLLSFCHVQLVKNFKMLESELAGVTWP